MHTQAFFLPVDPGQRFCLLHPAQGAAPRGALVYVHPFAEEMNKTRRMAALQARALSDNGYAVLQVDLLGCGDSSGDFGDAGWAEWVNDVVQACRWMAARNPGPLWIWGLRAGCLLAAQAAQRLGQLGTACDLLLWAPTPSGKVLLQQFLRLKAAGDLLEGNAKSIMDESREALAGGQQVEIAGYALSPALASGLAEASLAPTAGGASSVQRLVWLDVSSRPDASPTPAAEKTMAQWTQAGALVRSQVVAGPAFWQTSEIEEAPALLEATIAALESHASIHESAHAAH